MSPKADRASPTSSDMSSFIAAMASANVPRASSDEALWAFAAS
eukprot:CAMPEP_0198600444 /NCGR_PEP_ID=MMETSP1462-20131121/148240_1 /TAXON_ID=1333877 /ORGANISM="Brandtodinium nutriculum, Strain RCC3387" /LENGTH=42 /DNA_ID= /DNA_START= /DNA_END= /DNA_ORIENTATION=